MRNGPTSKFRWRRLQVACGPPGFTVIEVLVSMFVIGTLLALLLPAVVSSRESARMTECKNRLRQFGVALQAFAAAQQCLPELGTPGANSSRITYSPQVRLLPYLGEPALWEEFQRFYRNDSVLLQSRMLKRTVPAFQCPSDAIPNALNYRVCLGWIPDVYPCVVFTEPRGRKPNCAIGAFAGLLRAKANGKGVLLSEVVDGLSQTVAMSERLASDPANPEFDRRRDVWGCGASAVDPGVYQDPDRLIRFCEAFRGDAGDACVQNMGWHPAGCYLTGAAYAHALPPSSTIVDCTSDGIPGKAFSNREQPQWMSTGAVSARSLHTGGAVSVLFLDGAVRAESRDVDLRVWREISTIDGSRVGSL